MRKKITVVGAGFVGATLAQRVAERDFADVVLVDIIEGIPQGKALDILEAGPVLGYDSNVIGTNSYEETANSSIVVITSGFPRKPGMTRDDLVKANQQVISSVTQEIAKYSPDATLIIVTNPADAMAQLAYHVSKFPKNRVMGLGGVLDTARFRTFIAQELHVSVRDVRAYVLGGHGDTMIPLTRMTTVGGVPVSTLIPQERLDQIVQRARDGGAEIVNLLKTGSAFYAPSAAVLEMLEAVVFDSHRILPVSAFLQGEYGIHDLFVGVPALLSANGVEKIIELDLTDGERAALQRSANAVKEVVEVMGL